MEIKKLAFVGMLFSSSLAVAYNDNYSQGSAPCTISDGYQYVSFSNGASYSGDFKNCRPLSGYGSYTTPEGKRYSGYATATSDSSVRMNLNGEGYADIQLDLRRR